MDLFDPSTVQGTFSCGIYNFGFPPVSMQHNTVPITWFSSSIIPFHSSHTIAATAESLNILMSSCALPLTRLPHCVPGEGHTACQVPAACRQGVCVRLPPP